ncbi:MAG TPA: trehalase family glycosidase, partial [Actinocrinis sp.]|uniref:amylo-alpha-1,6-glucosidase n=1 Tax=Actinocrinis sp. TaxID=1920516 RepID=UPI002DDCBBD3
LPFDHQDEAGALPDSVTHSEILYNYVKPPIHGWALGILRRARSSSGPNAERLAEVYERLARWTRYWLDFRRAPGSGLAHYHHGNDSGWDNATVFDDARVVESGDLAAFLVLQLRELAALAPLVGRPDEAQAWNAEADRVSGALIDQLWDDGRFAAREVGSDAPRAGSSLLELMPIVLGDLLPEPIHTALADRISRHLTAYGLATELPTSPHYEADGYWRGPIWAPATVLVEDGLRRAGHVHLADEISLRFRSLCEASGFAENFDALTGAGQRDRAYTWTASAYLILAAAAEARRRRAAAH